MTSFFGVLYLQLIIINKYCKDSSKQIEYSKGEQNILIKNEYSNSTIEKVKCSKIQNFSDKFKEKGNKLCNSLNYL